MNRSDVDARPVSRRVRKVGHTCALGLAEQRIQKNTVLVGIDLDQPRAIGTEMEIEARQGDR